MDKLKFSVFAFLSIFFAAPSLFALPGVEQKIGDQSGQFVYYKDSTFERESYIGIVYFDDSTYGVRYYAPAEQKSGKPEISMQVYVTIDAEKAATRGTIDFTGEKVEPLPRSQDETDIINYLHDFFYEMFPRRIMMGTIDEATRESDDYAQFGGRVTIEWDPIIPILNLKRIVASDGKIALSAITGGKLLNSADTSFSDFRGIPSKISPKNSDKIKGGKKAPVEIENEGAKSHVFELDANWAEKGASIWMLSSVAAVSAAALPISTEREKAFERTLMLGRDRSYPDWGRGKITRKNGRTTIEQVFYNAENGTFQNDFKVIEPLAEGVKGMFTLTVDSGAYAKNKKYFDGILGSYRVK